MSSLKQEFEKFYQTHFDKVYRFVFFRCHDRELSEDLVSEIFMKVLQHFSDYDETRSKTAWLMTITKNHLANYWRDRKLTVPIDNINEDDEEGNNDSKWLKSALKVAEKQANKNLVYEILAKLSKEEAEIVTLHYIIGYNYAEVATMINTTEGAVKVASHRIIKKMKEYL
ncbi:MAG: RNA polymerase sigma factor [Patescibacteria group bacterium]|jgi:RNA polymerase sigma-70 factor (ECF subfamily)